MTRRASRSRAVLRGAVRALPVVLLLLAYALRVFRLGEANVWWDEALAVWAVRKSLIETTLWTAGDVHPPVFFWLLWPWSRLSGQTEFALRYLSVAFGLVTAALTYALGARLGGRRAGILALALVGLARFEVWWSMELRMYMLAGTFVLLATYAVTGWLSGRPRHLAVYVLAATAALYTIYLAAVALVALNLGVLFTLAWRWHAALPDARRDWIRRLGTWLVAQATVVALLAPWLAVALPRMQSWSSQRGAAPSLGFVTRLWTTLVATGVSTDLVRVERWTALFWLCALGVPALFWVRTVSVPKQFSLRTVRDRAVGDGGARSRRRIGLAVLVPFLVLPPLAVWAATQPRSIFYSPSVEARYLLPFAAPVYVLAAWLLASAWRRDRRVGAVLVLAALVPVVATLPGHYTQRRLRDELQTMVLGIWSQAEPGDVVLLVSGNRYPMFLYYYDQPWDVERSNPPVTWPPGSPPRWSDRPPVLPFPGRGSETVDADDWQGRLEDLLAQHKRVWLAEVDAHLQDPGGKVEAWLTGHRARVLAEGYGSNSLHLYASDGRLPRLTGLSSRWPWVVPLGFTSDYDLESLIPLAGLPPRNALPGDPLNFTLFRDRTSATSEVDAVSFGDVFGSMSAQSWQFMPVWRGSIVPVGVVPDRVLVRLAGSERFPAGRHGVFLEHWSRPVAEVTVRGTVGPVLGTRGSVDADFGFAALVAAGLHPTVVRPGDAVFVDLSWLPKDVSPHPEAWSTRVLADELAGDHPIVFAHLVGPPRPATADRVWSGQDGPPSSGAWSTPTQHYDEVYDRHVLTLDPAAPPGTYTVEVGLYDPATGRRYDVSGPGADAAAQRVVVGMVTVR